MQTKTIMRYHYSPIRIAKIIIKTILKTPNAGEDAEKHIVGRNVKWYNPSGDQFDSFLRK